MLTINQHLEQLLQLIPPSRPQIRHNNSQLRPQLLLPNLLHLQPNLRPVRPQPPITTKATPNKTSLIRYTGEFKWTVFTGIPILLLGTALLIPFRQPTTHVGILTMTQVLVGLGTCIFTVCGQLAIMAPVTHQEIAVVVAIWGLFGSIGAAVGSAIAGGMWNNILPGELYKRLPDESRNISATIFSDMVMQMSYADGTPEREAIVGAYADVQRKMVIAGVCFVPLCIACVWVWRDINVKKLEREQTRGNVW